MAARTLVQKFKIYTEVSEQDRDKIYDFIYAQKGLMIQGNNFSMEADNYDNLTVIVDQNDSRTVVTCHNDHMSVWVGRHYRESTSSNESNWSSEYEFNIDYDVSPEWMFQISTQYDLGFLEHRYIKYLRKLHEMYSLEEAGFTV